MISLFKRYSFFRNYLSAYENAASIHKSIVKRVRQQRTFKFGRFHRSEFADLPVDQAIIFPLGASFYPLSVRFASSVSSIFSPQFGSVKSSLVASSTFFTIFGSQNIRANHGDLFSFTSFSKKRLTTKFAKFEKFTK